jgi:hypothetical protein
MKRRTIAAALILTVGLCVIPLTAQELLPPSFGGWAASGAGMAAQGPQIDQLASNNASVLREYGIKSGERREYASDTASASITLYRMVDPSAAFGAFTFLRTPDMAPLLLDNSATYAAGTRNRTLFVVGNFLVEVTSPISTPSDMDFKALAGGLVSKADRRPFPIIADFLPKSGLIPGSERYVLGPRALAAAFPYGAAIHSDWAGFTSSAEAMVASYHFGSQKKNKEALLLVILYPTQQLAADRYASLTRWFAMNVDPSQAVEKPLVFGTRSSALIALLTGVESRQVATNLLNQIHYASDVTWNEPSQKFTDPSISTIVVGAIIDTGAIMMLAVAAGIGFGGFRLLVKLIFPGKVFDRNEDIEILQLGLSSKPIQAKDFYLVDSSRGS